MQAIFITIFPELVMGNFDFSILKRAIAGNLLSVQAINPRDFATDRQKMVDDIPYGGGGGMVLKPEPFIRAIKHAKEILPQAKVIALSPDGVVLNDKLVRRQAATEQDLIFVCGHYEGFDERIYHFVDEKISIGDYVLTGGELPAIIILESILRFVPGVLGNAGSAGRDTFANGLLEHPQYTRPVEFEGLAVPEVLRNGNHKEINQWRRKMSLEKTYLYRKDLLELIELDPIDKKLLAEIMVEQEKAST